MGASSDSWDDRSDDAFDPEGQRWRVDRRPRAVPPLAP
jgi:hypothetical protein